MNQRFLHALDAASGGFDQGLTVAEIGAESGDFGAGPETAAQQADAMKFANPLPRKRGLAMIQ